MNILTTGKGSSGSWQCRGVQLGGAVGQVIKNASLDECKRSDIIVAVKRLSDPLFQNIIKSGRPWIWDLVDFYPQPECSYWTRQYSIDWVRSQIEKFGPSGIIYPTKKMLVDIGFDGVWIPHHARPDTVEHQVQDKIKVVGYEGCEKYLGRWRELIENECRRRGWEFVCNTMPVGKMDIVVAFRDKEFGGYAQRSWKSNVKLANAHGSGTPFIGQTENGYLETATGCEIWVDHAVELAAAFDELEPRETRETISAEFKKSTITVSSCAEILRQYAKTLL